MCNRVPSPSNERALRASSLGSSGPGPPDSSLGPRLAPRVVQWMRMAHPLAAVRSARPKTRLARCAAGCVKT
jgi:hypothetical protein